MSVARVAGIPATPTRSFGTATGRAVAPAWHPGAGLGAAPS
jgi:hypothetical protein